MKKNIHSKISLIFTLALITVLSPSLSQAQTDHPVSFFPNKTIGLGLWLTLLIALAVIAVLYFAFKTKRDTKIYSKKSKQDKVTKLNCFLNNLESEEIQVVKENLNNSNSTKKLLPAILGLLFLLPHNVFSQTEPAKRSELFSQPGVLITFILIAIPLLFGIIFMIFKVSRALKHFFNEQNKKDAELLVDMITKETDSLDEQTLNTLKKANDFGLTNSELAGTASAVDDRGLIRNVNDDHDISFFAEKKSAAKRPKIDPQLTRLVLWFLGTAVFWLLWGTSMGEYLGIKYVTPDADSISWLSFGRLRAVHTNSVFWAWATLGMMGLGYYVVPMVSNAPLHSLKNGWRALKAVNIAMVVGNISVMAGINNGGGEYREFIWPIMALWAYGLILTLHNFIKTVAKRTTKEIYISNWYIIASYIMIIIVATLAYLPFLQTGIGETIVQGYYMHQAVGMWFMFSNLGFLYYFLPQQLNKPIYSYSLGVLAFWSQIIFYTLIGTHHFIFSALPWWLQTIAIVGSVGQLIAVISGTTNYLMTFKGSFSKIGSSYSLPFFLVGVIYYFTGSMQGTAEAFRETNLIWHFTDFTVAHSHITMYGIITFLLFAGIYAIVPRLTGNEPPKKGVGAHFWMALIGLQFYTIPLMIGGTLRGLAWAEGKSFIESVVLMAPYWLWRAIGGSLMWGSHIVLAYNFYKMVSGSKVTSVKEKAIEILKQRTAASK
ncbi:MAG: cbb3-type cytochrome c oxidase subunit I [Bacteroidia bacterium]|nr:cbb3-type cytochrome c oxidase subunit I [Bacteroidia bacterium]